MAWRAAPVALALVIVAACVSRADGQSILDFVTFDGIDYIRWAEEAGRPLISEDLGVEFAVVGCSFAEDRRGCPYGTDAGAAFMPTGSRIHAVKGYSTDFRLAAVWKDKIFLYQAWRNPRAKVGGDLYAIAGKCAPSTCSAASPRGRRQARRPCASARHRMPICSWTRSCAASCDGRRPTPSASCATGSPSGWPMGPP